MKSCLIDLTKMQKIISQHMSSAAMALLVYIAVSAMVPHLGRASALQRRLSMQGDNINNNMACNIRPPEPREIGATVIASYPGSGAKLSWKTIQALTGIKTSTTGDENGLISKNATVAIKTHYPALGGKHDPPSTIAHVPRAILLLRNPLNAISSFHNFEYERANHLPNHSTRAPTEAWIEWRNKRFDLELGKWKAHLVYWMDRHPAASRTIITFERMTNTDTGVEEFAKLGRGLQKRDPRIEVPVDDELSCIWDVIVNDKRVGHEGGPGYKSRRAGSERGPPPYENEHLERMEKLFIELKEMYLEREGVQCDLIPIMDDYVAMVVWDKRPRRGAEKKEATDE